MKPLVLQNRRISLVLTVLAFALSMLVGLVSLIHQTRDEQVQFKEMLYWSAAQLDREYWRFLESLSQYSASERSARRDELTLRYDILLSRIAVFETSEVGRRLSVIEGGPQTLAMLTATAKGIEPNIKALKPGDHVAATEIRDRLMVHAVALFQLGQRINQTEQANAVDYRRKTRTTYWAITAMLLGGLLTGTILVVL